MKNLLIHSVISGCIDRDVWTMGMFTHIVGGNIIILVTGSQNSGEEFDNSEERTGMKGLNKAYFCYLFIIILQILNMIYWANVKTNYYIDELYSMGYASSYTGVEDTARYITTSEEWKFNEWITNADLKKYLWVSDAEEIFSMPFTQAAAKLINSCNYFALLNMAESVSNYKVAAKWPGIILNMVLFVAAEIVLLALSIKLNINKVIIGLLLAMFGFCGYLIGIVEYIRFYMLVILLMLIMILLHYIVWTSDKLWQIIICEAGSLVMAYLGLKNSELMLAYAGALMGVFCIALAIARQWRKLGAYVFMFFMAGLYLVCKTEWLQILLSIGKYSGSSELIGSVSASIAGASVGQIIYCLKRVMSFATDFYFGNRLLFVLWMIAFFVFALMVFMQWKKKFLHFNYQDGFMLILAGTLMIYTLFIALTELTISRYYSLGFITFHIIFWYVIDWFIKRGQPGKQIRCYAVLVMLIVLSSLIPFKTRNIEYIYECDRELISSLQAYQGVDTVLASCTDESGVVSRHEAYDCVNLLDEKTEIYIIDMSEYIYQSDVFPDRFILWTLVDRDITELIADLEIDGYRIKYLSEDHISEVYICEKL